MDALMSAFLPSVTSSLAGGASGALEGQMAGEDRLLKNQLIEAQIAWQKAHAAGYGHMQKTSQEAMARLQEGIAKDPNYLSTPMGRFYSTAAGRFDLATHDAQAYANRELGESRDQHGALWGAQTQTEQDLRNPRVTAMTGLGDVRNATANQLNALTQPKVSEVNSRAELNVARRVSEGSLQSLRSFQGQLAQQRAELARAQKENAARPGGGHAPNLYSYAEMLHQRINDALEAQADGSGPGPDYNDILLLEDVRMKLRGPDFGALPLGGQVLDKRQGLVPEAAIPDKPGMLWGNTPGKAGSPPPVKPLDVAPRAPKSARPGTPEFDQAVLKARKLLKERGKAFADTQLSSNKALTPTEKLALKEALLSESVGTP